MSVQKIVSYHGPYVGKTFQDFAGQFLGADGYLSGASVTQIPGFALVGPYAFVQRGIVCVQDATTTIPLPATLGSMIFIVASTTDDDPASGVSLQATCDQQDLGAAVVVAFKANGRWQNPSAITVKNAESQDASDHGVDGGFRVDAPYATAPAGPTAVVDHGQVVDSNGKRRFLRGSGSTELFTAPSNAPSGTGKGTRNDYVVLRKQATGTAVVDVMGLLQASEQRSDGLMFDVLATSPVSSWSKRGSHAEAIASAWAVGNNLQGFFSLTLPGTGVITLYAGASAIANVRVVGQRVLDGAIIIVFTRGTRIKVASFNATTGATIDAPVTVDSSVASCDHVHAVIDSEEKLRVVYEQDAGAGRKQVYLAKVSLASLTWGVAAVSPRLVNGVDSTKHDTWPSFVADRDLRWHIAYATGNAPNYYGELRVAVLESDGTVVSRNTYSTYCGAMDPEDSFTPIVADVDVDSIQKPQVVVTPHNEVYAFMMLARASMGPTHPGEVAVFSETFQERFGAPILILSDIDPDYDTTQDMQGLGVLVDEQGQFVIVASWDITWMAGGRACRLDTQIAPFGILGDSYLESPAGRFDLPGGDMTEATEILVAPGPVGDVLVGYKPPVAIPGARRLVAQLYARGKTPTPHPQDVYLTTRAIESNYSTTSTLLSSKLQVFNTRPKRMNYPVLVGNNGDYQGHHSVHNAVEDANRFGGHIVLRGGNYILGRNLVLRSGVSMESEGRARLTFERPISGGALIGITGSTLFTPTVAVGQLITNMMPWTDTWQIHEGDVVRIGPVGFATSTWHRVRRVWLDKTTHQPKVLVDGAPPAVGMGIRAQFYSSGNRLSNITIDLTSQDGINTSMVAISASALFGARLNNVQIVGVGDRTVSTDPAVLISNCLESTIDGLDLSEMSFLTPPATQFPGITFIGGSFNQIRSSFFGMKEIPLFPGGPNGGYCFVGPSEVDLHISDCKGIGSGSGVSAVEIGIPRTTVVYTSNVQGNILNDSYTETSNFLQSRGPGALTFIDRNIQDAVSNPIALTGVGAGNTRFDGATPSVLVPSVNERVKQTGDTMTGSLSPAVGALLDDLGTPTEYWRTSYIGVGYFNQVQVSSPSTGLTPLTVNCKADQFVPNTVFTGNNGQLSDFVDSLGHVSTAGYKFFDDFYDRTWDTAGGDPTASYRWRLSGNTPIFVPGNLSPNNTHAVRLVSIAAPPASQTCSFETNRTHEKPISARISFRARVRFHASGFSGPDPTMSNRRDNIGLRYVQAPYYRTAQFEWLPASYATLQFWVTGYNAGGPSFSEQRWDTLFTPVANTWYWLYASCVGVNTFYWYIGNAQGAANQAWLASGAASPLGGLPLADFPVKNYLYQQRIAGAAFDKYLDVDCFEVWSNSRYSD